MMLLLTRVRDINHKNSYLTPVGLSEKSQSSHNHGDRCLYMRCNILSVILILILLLVIFIIVFPPLIIVIIIITLKIIILIYT